MADLSKLGGTLVAAAIVAPVALHALGFGWLGPYAFAALLVGAVAAFGDAATARMNRRIDDL